MAVFAYGNNFSFLKVGRGVASLQPEVKGGKQLVLGAPVHRL